MREPSVVIPVTASVDDDGLVHIEGDDLSLVRWNHRLALVRAALERFGGRADWKPRWYLLAVPTEAFMGSARSVFSLAALDERRDCRVIRRTDSDGALPRAGTPARQRYVDGLVLRHLHGSAPGECEGEASESGVLTAAMGAWYLQPPTRFTPFPMLVRAIAKRESRDVAANLRALATIKNTPEKLDKSYL
jgi:hypothetical protein